MIVSSAAVFITIIAADDQEKVNMAKENKTISAMVLDFFISLKLTIFLLIFLALTSIIGTVIRQNADPSWYIHQYSQTSFRIFSALDFLDLYHSWWFLALISLLSLNLTACSIRRFPVTWKRFCQKKVLMDDGLHKSLPNKESFGSKISPEILNQRYCSLLGKVFARPVTTHSKDDYHLFSEKGKYSIFGVYVVHFSILVILAGSMVGNFFGYEGYMQLEEGQTREGIYLKNTKHFKKLGFSVRCDDFKVTYYKESKQPKDYKSILTIIDQGEEVLTKTIEVNHPLRYRGIFFYQSNYGTTTRNGKLIISVTPQKDEKKSKRYQVGLGESFQIEGTDTWVKAARFIPDFMIDEGKVVSKSNKLLNPAVELVVIKDQVIQYSTWAFQRYPSFHGSSKKEFDLKLIDFQGSQYTGLQVAKDPGVMIVWAGCILLIVGIMVTFFLSHQRIWLRIAAKDKKSLITLAGSANKNREDFERKFGKLANMIKEADK